MGEKMSMVVHACYPWNGGNGQTPEAHRPGGIVHFASSKPVGDPVFKIQDGWYQRNDL